MAGQPTRRGEALIGSYRKAIALQPGNFALHLKLATALMDAGKLDEAAAEYRKMQQIKPGFAKASEGLATIAAIHRAKGGELKKKNQPAEAVAAYQKYLACTPHIDFNVLLDIGLLLYNQKQVEGAIKYWQQAAAIKPDCAAAYHNIGVALRKRAQRERAAEMLRKAISVQPDYVNSYNTLVDLLTEQGAYDEAVATCRQLLEVRPGDPDAIASLASVYERQGKIQEAHDLLRPLVEAGVKQIRVVSAFATVCHRLSPPSESAIPLLQQALKRTDMGWENRKKILTGLANLCDVLERYEEAFSYLSQARALEPVDAATLKNRLEFMGAMKKAYTRERLATLPKASNRSELPVFIVGMPRSGTTLAEQILASHPRGFGAGELTEIGKLAVSGYRTGLSYPQCLDSLTQEKVDALAAEHLERLRALSPAAERVVDKMPLNFLHLGLIQVLFPGARVIHCTRHPLDTCISIFFNEFAPDMVFTRDLAAMGSYYRHYRELMQHWQETLDIPIHTLSYEDVVANPEDNIRGLLEFCGLEWNDACMKFFETKRHVDTPSYHQVRKPIYTRSVGRYKVYEPWLGPLKEALGEP